MFKNLTAIDSKNITLLKAKELKKLKNDLTSYFQSNNKKISTIDDTINVFINKNEMINVIKLNNSRTLLFTVSVSNNSYCLFINLDNRNIYIPSLYQLWHSYYLSTTSSESYKCLIPTIVINEEVSYFILRGNI